MSDERMTELAELMGGLRDEDLTAEDARRLEHLVCDDETSRRRYVQYMHMVADLQWVASERSGRDLLARLSLESDDARATGGVAAWGVLPESPPAPNLFSRWGLGGGWIDAAPVVVFGVMMLAVGLLVGWGVNRGERTEPQVAERDAPRVKVPERIVPPRAESPVDEPTTIAQLVRTVDCQWDNSTLPTQAGSAWPTGRVRLSRGRALIRFESGAEVMLEGPSVFQLNDAMQSELLSGQLVARVPAAAVGFTIETPTATVVDLGTEFGLVADAQGATEVHVFDGEVELRGPSHEVDRAVTRLGAGEARRLESVHGGERGAWRELPVNRQRFARDVNTPSLPLEVEGELLLADDFRGAKLDAAQWRVVTEGIPAGRAAVRVSQGRAELVNRGHLVSVAEFVPNEKGDLRIRGRFTLGSPKDMLQVLTRSDGRPREDSYGDTTNGVECFINMDAGGVMGIYGRGEVRLNETFELLEIAQGETFDFEILDTGTRVTFTVRKVGGDGASATVSTYCDQRTEENFVVIHNRERSRVDRVAELHHVVIERVASEASDANTTEERGSES